MPTMSLASILVQDPPNPFLTRTPPIAPGAPSCFDSMAAMQTRTDLCDIPYARGENPVLVQFEQKIAQLEGGEAARAFASGMGAISAALMSVLRAGERVVCVKDVYADTSRLLEKLLARHGIATTYVDGSDTQAVLDALPGARVLYLESPTSWTFRTQNLSLLAAAARAQNVVTICDNSWATPLHQQPLTHGIDMVVHAACKYLGGQGDTTAGVVVGSQARINALQNLDQPDLGARLAAWEAWLLLRGMRTLAIRMAAQWQCAEQLMERLSSHRGIAKILHPAWQTGPGNHCLSGYSSLFSVVLAEHIDIGRFCHQLQLFRRGVCWGGHESLVLPAQVALAQGSGPNTLRESGVSERYMDRCVRFYIGFEALQDLWADLQQALEMASGPANHTPLSGGNDAGQTQEATFIVAARRELV